jgi:hypothetical protein
VTSTFGIGTGQVLFATRSSKQGTTAGVIVGDDSSDPGLLHVDPVGIDADHLDICKPADASDLVYIRTRDFIADEIVPDVGLSAGYGTFQACDLPKLPRSRSNQVAPIALRLAIISIVGLLFFKGTQALFFPPDVLGKASVEQITGAILAKSPNLTPTQIEQFIGALRQARGDPSCERSARWKKPRRATRALQREYGAKSMRIEKRNKTKHDKSKLTRRVISQPASSPTTLRKDCLGIDVAPLQLTANNHLTSGINSVHLEDRLGDVEPDCRDRLHG